MSARPLRREIRRTGRAHHRTCGGARTRKFPLAVEGKVEISTARCWRQVRRKPGSGGGEARALTEGSEIGLSALVSVVRLLDRPSDSAGERKRSPSPTHVQSWIQLVRTQ